MLFLTSDRSDFTSSNYYPGGLSECFLYFGTSCSFLCGDKGSDLLAISFSIIRFDMYLGFFLLILSASFLRNERNITSDSHLKELTFDLFEKKDEWKHSLSRLHFFPSWSRTCSTCQNFTKRNYKINFTCRMNDEKLRCL